MPFAFEIEGGGDSQVVLDAVTDAAHENEDYSEVQTLLGFFRHHTNHMVTAHMVTVLCNIWEQYFVQHMGVSENSGIPNWMVYNEQPY